MLVDSTSRSDGESGGVTTAETASMPISYIHGPPEQVFGVAGVVGTSLATVGEMTLDASMIGPDDVTPGVLGVLVDTAIGSAAVAHRPAGGWAVTTDLTITFCGGFPSAAGTRLVARGRCVHHGSTSASATGTVTDGNGGMVAAVVERIEFSTASPQLRTVRGEGAPAGSGRPLSERLGLRRSDGTVELDVVDPLVNPGGSLHGGIAIYASDVAGASAVSARVPGLVTASLHITYLRPGPAGSTLGFVTDVVHIGRNSALVTVDSVRPDGKVCTRASIAYRRP
ncbi:PaaI family thioesterase [Gordonia sp. NPDC003376]